MIRFIVDGNTMASKFNLKENFLKNIGELIIYENQVEFHFNPNKVSTKKVIETLYNSDLDIIDFSTKDISLEDIFINMTNEYNKKI